MQKRKDLVGGKDGESGLLDNRVVGWFFKDEVGTTEAVSVLVLVCKGQVHVGW